MQQNNFTAYATARRLAGLMDDDMLLPAFASSSINIYPYQVAAARFALRSPYLNGCILCDEGSLGKTYEALLIAAQKWYEGKDRLLLVLPPNLVSQWIGKIEGSFTLPYFLWDSGNNLPDEDGLAIVTYDFAVRHADVIAENPWDLIIFDEADVLSKRQNKTVMALKQAAESSFKLLLTPTPITMSIMDIYGLLHFIDESILPDADDFYKRYFRKPENYPELTSWGSQYAFRTLKSQVSEYVGFTERIPLVLDFPLSKSEKELYKLVADYLALPQKAAYPQMDKYELTLMFYHILSSSPQAFCKTLEGAIARLDDEAETAQLTEILLCAKKIDQCEKSKVLLKMLKQCFSNLNKLKLPKKAVVFVDNLITLSVLADFLSETGYEVIETTKPDYMERFRGAKSAVLLATDTAAKGLDMEFCPVVINYDLSYNAVEMEQRISRCHRQGQQSDVLVVNLLCKENPADVRILELINKRVLQFDGIFGMSDEIVGNFDVPLEQALAQIRQPDAVQESINQTLHAHKDENEQTVSHAEDILFTTFTKAVADKVAVTPKYMEDKIAGLNEQLWDVVAAWFAGREDYTVDEQARTVSLTADAPPQLFYYWTGSRNKPYTGRKQYGMDRTFQPKSGRISLTSILARGIFSEISCAESGEITLQGDAEPCEIGLYDVQVLSHGKEVALYPVLAGRTQSGRVLDDAQCYKLLSMPATSCLEIGKVTSYWLRNATGSGGFHPLDNLISTEQYIEKYCSGMSSAIAEESERINLCAARKKAALEHTLDDLCGKIKKAQEELTSQSGDRLKELTTTKQIKALEKDLRSKEQKLFFEQMRINVATEDEIAALSAKENYEVRLKRQFVVKVLSTSE